MRRFFSVGNLICLLIGLVVIYHFHINKKRNVDLQAEINAELAELNEDWVLLRAQQGEIEYSIQECERVNKKREQLKAEIAQMQKGLLEHKAAIQLLAEQRKTLFSKYREQVRKEAKGMRFAEIITPQGKTYLNVKINEVRSDGISFSFGAAGSASGRGIGLHEIPSEWIRRFMYTEEELEWARSWTSADGARTIHGKFKTYDEDTGVVTILQGDRKRSLNIDNLSKANRDWLENLVSRKRAKEAAIFALLDKQAIGSKIKKGVLSKLDGDHFYDFTMSNVPDYYVVYYSSSW